MLTVESYHAEGICRDDGKGSLTTNAKKNDNEEYQDDANINDDVEIGTCDLDQPAQRC